MLDLLFPRSYRAKDLLQVVRYNPSHLLGSLNLQAYMPIVVSDGAATKALKRARWPALVCF